MSVVALTAVLLLVFNILMWLIFLHRFNSFFSTERIISDFRNAINEKIREANNAADRNMNLVDDKIQQLNKVKAEAERRLAVLRRELDTQQRESEFRNAMSNVPKNSRKSSSAKNNPVQGELVFTEKARSELGVKENTLAVPAENMENSESEEILHEIPVVSPVIYKSENQIVPQKDFPQQVKELYSVGLDADEIAHRTNRSVQEVRLVLQML